MSKITASESDERLNNIFAQVSDLSQMKQWQYLILAQAYMARTLGISPEDVSKEARNITRQLYDKGHAIPARGQG